MFLGIFNRGRSGPGLNVPRSQYYRSDHTTIRFRSRIIRDTDAIHYNADNFGELADYNSAHTMKWSGSRRPASNLKTHINDSGNELLPKDFVSISEIDQITVASKYEKDSLIEALKEAGIQPSKPPNRRWSSIIRVKE